MQSQISIPTSGDLSDVVTQRLTEMGSYRFHPWEHGGVCLRELSLPQHHPMTGHQESTPVNSDPHLRIHSFTTPPFMNVETWSYRH